MLTILKNTYLESSRKFHRIILFFLAVSVVLSYLFLDSGTKPATMIFYLVLCVACFVFDLFYQRYSQRKEYYSGIYVYKVFVYLGALIGGAFIGSIPIPLLGMFLIYGILLICESVLLNDVYDIMITYRDYFFFTTMLMLAMVLPFRSLFDSAIAILILIAGAFLFPLVHLLRQITIQSMIYMDRQYTHIFFRNLDVEEENTGLVEMQQRLEEVNETINYQRVQLNDALSDLKKRSEETHALIDITSHFTSTFDLAESLQFMVQRLVELKNANICCFLIDKDICLNEEIIFEAFTDKNYGRERLKKETYQIFEEFKKSGSRDPMVICDNYDQFLPYFERRGCCISAIPAYEQDSLYGVMVLAGEKYDFFYGGYDFYKTAIGDLTTAMIKDRLYLTTEDMAKKDGLTKIYNRIYFNQVYPDMLQAAKDNGSTISVLMLDIDHFKNVNDTYGHLAGDEAIRYVARSDWEVAKKYNGMAVRFGGEEFLLILPDTPLEKAKEIAAELHEKIRTTVIHFEDYEININTSLGVANYPTTVQDTELTLDRSDKAMYYGKTHGRGRIIVDGVDNVEP
ncbi:MAG: GGDEF domain-containing protein [Eubacterium sp.]|nr:GGDEF domain-containing protein [Eubacterium sp.]